MYIVFRYLLISKNVEVQVWPDLREAHDATCNKGVGKKDLETKFPRLDFGSCAEEWDFPPHSTDDATVRAERVRWRVGEIAREGRYKDVVLITHRGFAAFMVQGERFSVCGKQDSNHM
jgi:broad specificity phosphatase PhoE